MTNELTRQIDEIQASIKLLETQFKSKKAALVALESKSFPDPDDSIGMVAIVRALQEKDRLVAENKAAMAALKPEIEALGVQLASKRELLQKREALATQVSNFLSQAHKLEAAYELARTEHAKLLALRDELVAGRDFYEVFRRHPIDTSERLEDFWHVVVSENVAQVRIVDGRIYRTSYQPRRTLQQMQEVSNV